MSPGTAIFGGDRNTIHLIDEGGVEDWPVMTKREVADRLADRIAAALAGPNEAVPGGASCRPLRLSGRRERVTGLVKVELKILDPRLPGWGFPRRGSALAAGLDLHACIDAPFVIAPQAPAVLISAGIAFRIGDPEWCALVLPRSGLGHREGLVLGNAVGLIDADYEGPCLISAWNRNPAIAGADGIRICTGGPHRPARLYPHRTADFAIVGEFSQSGERQARAVSDRPARVPLVRADKAGAG